MDQDSFRQLLSSSSSTARTFQPRESLFTAKKNPSKASARKPSAISANEPAFKPRKVKKLDGKYRDRAAERRVGEGNDYAQVEAVLEEFEKRTADQDEDTVCLRLEHAPAHYLNYFIQVDEQRQYLGGDSEHTVLVKGLDMALLQQNKAKAAMATDEDDSLEQAYIQASSESSVPKKRTREEIIRELKEKRAKGDNEPSASVEDPELNKNKFKPIGFKPIGGQKEKKKKKAKGEGEGERKKKKRKIDDPKEETRKEVEPVAVLSASSSAVKSPPAPIPAEDEPAEISDIFADVDEYEGVDVGVDSDEESEMKAKEPESEEVLPSSLGPGRWFATDEQEETGETANESLLPVPVSSLLRPPPPPLEEGEASDDEEQPTRLVPLSGSAIPSIKELLAIDDAAGASGKKRNRKKKKKGEEGEDEGTKKKLDTEAKVERDYQRLKSYTEKRGAAS
ncbi:RED-like protein N-terminal region-domain-containing protein [Rhodocollybia butyracea]|uniref:RED-like protein N-terminal region-domain-containing protein n=1 Tax=Rhodocollybia butyracea TaxID=206335 RepID=A0A9P5UCL8_9AGAR|nr:RED-like protein N-terminal region-domain-containing protein [Rhodocollybia butyracea]